MICYSKVESDYRNEVIDLIIRYYNKEKLYNQLSFDDEREKLYRARTITGNDKKEIKNIIKSIENKCKGK